MLQLLISAGLAIWLVLRELCTSVQQTLWDYTYPSTKERYHFIIQDKRLARARVGVKVSTRARVQNSIIIVYYVWDKTQEGVQYAKKFCLVNFVGVPS